jgi:hypothetical protein
VQRFFSFKILNPTEMPMRDLTFDDKIALNKSKTNCLTPVITSWWR